MPYGGAAERLGGSRGSGFDLVAAAERERKMARRARKKREKGSDGLFGLGFGPDYSVGDLIREPVSLGRDLVGFLVGAGTALGSTTSDLAWAARKAATGDTGAAKRYLASAGATGGTFGKGMVSSFAGTAADIADIATVQPARAAVGHAIGLEELAFGPGKYIRAGAGELLGEQFKPKSFGERVEERRSFLSPLIEDVGNVALGAVGAVGALKGASAIGVIGKGTAAKALSKVEPFKTPLREGWERTGRPVTIAARSRRLGNTVSPDEVMLSYWKRHGKEFGLDRPYAVDKTRTLPEEQGKALAKVFREAPTVDDIRTGRRVLDKETVAAYKQFAKELDAQYEHIFGDGKIKVTFGPREANPYPKLPDGVTPDPQAIFEDIQNGHLWVDETGPGEAHPFLTKEQNDKFRAVHDFLGHSRARNDFGMAGEEVAYQHHAQMFSPLARRALAMETRGFQGDLHYSPENLARAAAGQPKEFGPQRAALIPEEMADPLYTLPPAGRTPAMQAAVRTMHRPAPPTVARLLDRLDPESPIIRVLDWMERHSLAHDTRLVVRQLERHMEAARNQMRVDPAVQAAVATARKMIEEKGLNAYEANAIVGDELEWRLSAKNAIWDDAIKEHPELLKYLRQTYHRTVDIPEGVLTPDVVEALDRAAEMWRVKAEERYQALISEGRLGEKGLEQVGTDEPMMTRAEAQRLAQAKKNLERAHRLRVRAQKERARWEAEADRLRDRSSRLAAQIAKDIAAGRRAVQEFDRSRTFIPAGFRSETKFAERAAQMVKDTLDNGGSTYSPFEDRFLVPAAYGGQDVGWAVSLAPESRLTIPVDQWAALGPDAIKAVAKGYQELFDDPHHLIGTWLEEETGTVHIDISQTHYNGHPLTRDEAIILGHARLQKSVFDFESGETLWMDDTPGRPDIAAAFADNMARRTQRWKTFREAVKQRKFPFLTQADIDGIAHVHDRIAVELWRNGRIKSPDDYYASTRFVAQTRVSPNLFGKAQFQTVLDLDYRKPEVLEEALRRTKNVAKKLGWYYKSHDAIESLFRFDPLTGQERLVLLPSGHYRPAADLVYDLIALTSVQASPTTNLGHAFSALEALEAAPKAPGAARNLVRALERGKITPARAARLADEFARQVTAAEGMHPFASVKQNVYDLLIGTITDPVTGVERARSLNEWDQQWLMTRGERIPGAKTWLPKRALTMSHEQALMEYGSQVLAKLKSFRDNLARPEESVMVTLDSWMARGEGLGDTNWGLLGEYGRGVEAIAEATRTFNEWFPEHKVQPHAVQALFWAFVKEEITKINRGRFIAITDLATAAIRNGALSIANDPTPRLWQHYLEDAATGAPAKRRTIAGERVVHREIIEDVGGGTAETIDYHYVPTKEKAALQPFIDQQQRYAKVQEEVLRLQAAGDLVGAEAAYRAWVNAEWTIGQRVWGSSADAADFETIINAGANVRRPRRVDRALARMETTPLGSRSKTRPYETIDDAVRARFGITSLDDAMAIADAPVAPDIQVLAQQFGARINGAFLPLTRDGRYELRFFRTADTTTLFHETGHMLEVLLPDNELRLVEEAYGLKNRVWTPEAKERFANDVVRYFNQDRAPAGLAAPFARIRQVLADMYAGLAHQFLPTQVSPRVQGVLDRWFDPERIEVDRTVVPGTRGEVVMNEIGEPVRLKETGSLRQRLRRAPRMPGLSAKQGYARGVGSTHIVRDIEALSQRVRQKEIAKGRVDKALAEIEKVLSEGRLPSVIEAERLEARALTSLKSLNDALNRAPASRVPPEWQHVWASVQDLAKIAKDDPVLADMLAEVPQTFSEVVQRAREKGFDPVHVRDFAPHEVQSLVYDTVMLGKHGRLGRETEAGTRRARTMARVRSGDVERSIESFAAAHLEVVHERLSNELVTFIEDHLAIPVEAGDTLPPTGTVAWDPVRRVILGEERSVTTHEAHTVVKQPTRYVIPKEVATVLRRMTQDYRHGVFSGLSKITNPWRALVLTMSPRWYVNNFLGNLTLATMAGVRLRDWVTAWESYKKQYTDVPAVTRRSFVSDIGEGTYIPNARGLQGFREAARNGADLRTSAAKVLTHAGFRLRRLNEAVDEFARAAVYHKTIRTVGDAERALHAAYEALVDYGNLSPFERQAVRAVIPFYAWQKGVLKIAARLPVDHPIVAGFIVRSGQMQQELLADKWGGTVPTAYLGLVSLPGGGAINTRGMNPLADALSLTTADGIASSLNPFVSLVTRSVFGAPELGYTRDVRMDPYGFAIPDPSITEGLADLVTGVPGVQAGQSAIGKGRYGAGQGALRFVGVPYMTPADLRRAIERARKTRVRQGVEAPKRREPPIIPLGTTG